MSKQIIARGNYEFVILEELDFENKVDLLNLERHYQEIIPNINHCRAIRTDEEIKNQTAQYYLDNYEKIKKQTAQYRLDNSEKIKEQKAQFYLDNYEKIKEQQAQYRLDNSEKLNEQQVQYYLDNYEKINEKFDCECGGKYTKQHQSRHFKSQRHISYLNGI